VAQLFVELARWASRSPSDRLQAVALFDEADLYLPDQGKPPTKESMENLLRRARSAGLGVLLATQSPGDLDYKCRDNIRTWLVGQVKEPIALAKMRPMLAECRADIESRLPGQGAGEFHLLRDGSASGILAGRNALPAVQRPEDQIQALARRRS
jgi:DNA helicase HerA-like ATPase